jgi:ribosomal protein S12 methylthiotransferase
VDIPLQHVNDRMLGLMGRKMTRSRAEDLIGELRERIPGVTLRTTFIAGFPGETDEEYQELLEFVEQTRFDRMGCFAYSQEEDTRAAVMPEQVPPEVREKRRDRLMAAQQPIAFELAEARVGERCVVLIEDGDTGAEDVYAARSVHEAPDVDPVIYVTSENLLQPGDFVEIEIVGADGYDCIGVAPGEHGV